MGRIDLSVRIRNGRLRQIDQPFKLSAGDRFRATFQCACGNKTIARVYDVKCGSTLSCGCLKEETRTRHGHTSAGNRTPTWQTWSCMTRRCSDKSDGKNRRRYYLRGIRVCERWLTFENFLEDMGERPEGFTLERDDNDGDYCKENCQWIPRNEQARNTQNTVWVPVDGVLMCASQAARVVGINVGTLLLRIASGWSPERAISTPVRKMKRRRK